MIRVVEEGAALLMVGNENTDSNTPLQGQGSDVPPATDATGFDHGDFAELDVGDGGDVMNAASPLNGIADNVLGDIMRKQTRPNTTWENVLAFKSAITWKEPFILFLLAFHLCIILFTVYTTRRGGLGSRFALLAVIAIIVRSAETFNGWGAQHWESFATQDYFDDRGVFVGLMLSGPLLLASFCMLIAFLKEASGLLVEVKTMELKQKKMARAKDGNKGKGKKGAKKNAKQD